MADVIDLNYMRVFNTYDEMLDVANPGGLAWVIDASGDPTVGTSSALYFYKNGWQKKYEMEDMDAPKVMVSNLNVLRKFSLNAEGLLFDGVKLALAADIVPVVNEVAGPIITQAISDSVAPIVTSLVSSSLETVRADLNSNIDTLGTTLRSEFAEADATVLSTANNNIATAKAEVLGSVLRDVKDTQSMDLSITTEAGIKTVSAKLRVDAAAGNRLSVSEDGVYVQKELPSNAVENDIAIFDGTKWIKMALADIPSTLGWSTV